MIGQQYTLSTPSFALAVVRLDANQLHAPEQYLSESELTRLSGIHHAYRREEFLAGRWLVRTLWQSRYGGELADFVLQERESQVPKLLSQIEWRELSISHGGGFVAAAIAPAPIGIDVEASTRQLNAQVFAKLLGESTASLDSATLLQRWVACESLLKQQGAAALPEHVRAFAVRPATPEQTARCWTRSIELDGETAVLAIAPAYGALAVLDGWQPQA